MKIKILTNLVIFGGVIGMVFFGSTNQVSAQTATHCYCTSYPPTQVAECSMILGNCERTGFSCESVRLTQAACEAKVQDFNNRATGNLNDVGGTTESTQSGGIASKILPPCVLKNTLEGDCRDVTIFLTLMFQIIHYLFGIIGGVALLYFVYGGFVFILSQGSPDKVNKGKGIIIAAVLGIIIAFSGYALVKFVGDVVGIESEFKLN